LLGTSSYNHFATIHPLKISDGWDLMCKSEKNFWQRLMPCQRGFGNV